jgi:ABC-type multidrug transport system ATPase subunit
LCVINQLVIIASIHQPSTTTFNLFDDLCLLARGQTCYFGAVTGVIEYFASIGYPMPSQINPAEYMLELVNADFSPVTDSSVEKAPADKVAKIHEAWKLEEGSRTGQQGRDLSLHSSTSQHEVQLNQQMHDAPLPTQTTSSFVSTVATLLHRSFIKSYRDVLVYGVRIVMYLGLAILMGTVWVRMSPTQDYIQPFINSIVRETCCYAK